MFEQHLIKTGQHGTHATFKDMGLEPFLIGALKSVGFKEPTPIQAKAIYEIMSGKNVLFSAETGSGKTLAYLIPLLHMISRHKEKIISCEKAPSALIIAPSRELAEQIGKVTMKLASLCGLGVAPMIGGLPKNWSHSGYDIIVTTMGLIPQHINSR